MSAKERRVRQRTDGAMPRQGLRRLPDLLERLLDTSARRRGFTGSTLIADWPLIVGPALARTCHPVRLDRRQPPSLHLRVNGSAALEVQHMSPQIIERINQHFGFAAIARLKLVQAPAERRRPATPDARSPRSPEAEEAIDRTVSTVAHPDLRAALRKLGHVLPSPRAAASGG